MSELVHFSTARQALQKARTIDEVKSVRDAAERLRLYLRQVNESLEMQNDAAEIKLRAERRAGEMLREGAESGDRQKAGRPNNSDIVSPLPTLKEIGIEKKQSERWQAIASIPEEEFEKTIQETKQSGEEHALLVRPLNGHYQICSGHTRTEAVKRTKLKDVPCWVKEMTDAEALMELVLSNSQGELSHLEYGIHALTCVPLGEKGEGHKGGLRGYARQIGKSNAYVQQGRNAARFFRHPKVNEFLIKNGNLSYHSLLEKTKHFDAAADLPEDSWQGAAEYILKNKKGKNGEETEKQISAADVEKNVKAAIEAIKEIPPQLELVYPIHAVALKVFTEEMSRRAIQDCVAAMLTYRARIAELAEEKALRAPELESEPPAEEHLSHAGRRGAMRRL